MAGNITQHFHEHNHYSGFSQMQYKEILSFLKQILMTQAELLQKVNDLEAKAAKNQTELLSVLEQLNTAIANSQNVDPAIVEAVGRLDAILNATDELVPDAPAPQNP